MLISRHGTPDSATPVRPGQVGLGAAGRNQDRVHCTNRCIPEEIIDGENATVEFVGHHKEYSVVRTTPAPDTTEALKACSLKYILLYKANNSRSTVVLFN